MFRRPRGVLACGAAIAGLVIAAALTPPAARATPETTLLTTPQLSVAFDPQTGLPAKYRLPGREVLGAEREELRRAQWEYAGGRTGGDEYGKDIHVSRTDGASFEFTFTGTGVEYVTDRNSDKGKLDIFVDGVFRETVDAYHPTRIWQASVYSITGLPAGEHTIKGVKRSGEYAIVDAFKVHSGTAVTTVNNDAAQISYSREPGFANNVGAVVGNKSTGAEARAAAVVRRIDVRGPRASVAYRLDVDGSTVASFALVYAVKGSALQVTLEEVTGRKGWELIEVHTPSLVTVAQSEKDAWIAHGNDGGLLAPLATAKESSLPYGVRGQFPNFSILPLTLLGKAGVSVAMEVPGYLNNTALTVYGAGAAKKATVGAVTLHRIPGGATTPSLPVEQNQVVRLDFVGDTDRSGTVDWLDAAKVVKARIPKNPTKYYDDKFMYALQGQVGPTDRTAPEHTFPQAEDLVKRVSSLIDGRPQVVFMAGWPEGGHDTSYPAVGTVNPELGGKAGFDRLQTNARTKYNTNVTLDDNWDDQYDNAYTAGVFDPKYITVTREGELERHNAWNGVDLSYITGFAKYMAGPGRDRAPFTKKYYGLRDGVLIDGMSWWSIRNDFDPAHPASAVKNLEDGKFELIDQYARLGISVGSELLRSPFIGRLGFTMDGPTGGGWNGFGGTPIPLMSLVLRDSTIYGINSGGSPDLRSTLFNNNRTHTWLDKATPDAKITGLYYLQYLPWMKLHDLDVQTFQRDGQTATIGFGGGTSVFVDDASATQRVVYRGVEIMNGNSVTVPMDDRRIAFYSDTAKTLSYPLPHGADPAKLRAKLITATEHVTHPVTVKAGRITVDVPANTPVVVTTR
ncbi:endo-alpha-N-acetylgalactosaminidase family protein [Kribbella italica]|uniref:Endo-alpha-N-acetylgalactosaminidase domain-containing protein n=1 Tax=Kribbella italica TaxID=1540520 RepID=A0A7W9J5J6_9ACTN|nr:endo-alpha-N-acetylgalactosaminidase family protein [Kribbella italica]MBB5835794.1 hypothetical protein [Kribbella italica]